MESKQVHSVNSCTVAHGQYKQSDQIYRAINHDSTYVELVTLCQVMAYIVNQKHVRAIYSYFGHWTVIHVAISDVERQANLDEEEAVSALVLYCCIWLSFTHVSSNSYYCIHITYIMLKLQDRPCHLQTPASEYTSKQINDLIFVCILCLARGVL